MKAFTLVEILVVIALIGILAAVSAWAINPAEIFKKSRDSVRLSDLQTIRKAVDLSLTEGFVFDLSRCTPAIACNSLSDGRSTGGSGYVTINLSKYLSILPSDPLYSKSTFVDGKGNLVSASYQFASDGDDFEIRAHLEAKVNTSVASGDDRYSSDGGCNNDWFEVGTNLCLIN